MNSTKLSTILNRMNRYQTISNIEEQYKVRDLDDALRNLRREIQPAWINKKGTIRVFDDVLEYPIAPDHDALHYIDNSAMSNNSFSSQSSIQAPANFFYTSLKEFYEDPDYRNDLAEIWDNGTRFLGIRYTDFNFGSQTIDTSTDVSIYSTSGDAGTPILDQVFFKVGNSSIKVPITSNTGIATIVDTPGANYDANYKRKYYFRYIYLNYAPTSIELRFGNDSSNYMSKVVTTQFSGVAFKEDDWNLVAFDLNAPDSIVGTISNNIFDYESIILNGAISGNYYINQSYLREWSLMDYWYYSSYNVATLGSSFPNQDYFMDDNDSYSIDTVLIGDKEWSDVIMYDAILIGMEDEENSVIKGSIQKKRDAAFQALKDNYPSEKPLITNRKYLFDTDFTIPTSVNSSSN